MNKRIFLVLTAAILILLLAACKTEAEPTASTHENIPGVTRAPEEFLDETKSAETEKADFDEEAEQTENASLPNETDEKEETEGTEEKKETGATEETEESTAKPEEDTTIPSKPSAELTEYEWYNALSGEEQMAFLESFDSIPAFFEWYNAAKAEYEKLHPNIEIDDGIIDLGGLAGGNG